MFVDAMIDLQTVVECLQQDNTNLFPHCSTFYNCGLTVFDAPRGTIKRVSVMDKQSASSTSTSTSTPASGQVADYKFPFRAIFDPPFPATIIYNVAQAGDYTVTVNQTLGDAQFGTGPQSILTSITYTDTNGQLQTVTPASACTWGETNTGSQTISCAANSKITAAIAVDNSPFNDGGYTVEVLVSATGDATVASSVPATLSDDYCSEIPYNQVDACHIHNFLRGSRRRGCCLSIPFFFGIAPGLCGKAAFPIPTDAGLPAGLPLLPLGFHYPQTSTDRRHGRAGAGIWAVEEGKIWIGPWIQSTETVIVKWEGIKRQYSDADPVDDDPLLAKALEDYVRWKHAEIYDHDYEAAAASKAAYEGSPMSAGSKQLLIHQCREETRVRECEPMHARGSSNIGASLFYNDAQTAQASCPAGTTGNSVSVTIPAGTVGSTISVNDANATAKAQAQAQAQAQLVCTPVVASFTNDAQTATLACQGSAGAPAPDGAPVTVTIPAGTVTGASKAEANANALALAQTQAADQLHCTYWNSAQSYTATCPNDSQTSTVTIAQHTYSSTISQADADAKALAAATTQAQGNLSCSGGLFWNTPQSVTAKRSNCLQPGSGGNVGSRCSVTVNMGIAAHVVSSVLSQADANQHAIALATGQANALAAQYCQAGQCGTYGAIYQA